tara:strand:+ start:1928 stop:2356 length:429 start_codon:yes stop_codon:yes gene_type:complete
LELTSNLPNSKLVTSPEIGHLVMFRYKAKLADKIVYDKTPCLYVAIDAGGFFYGCNLHYYPINARKDILETIDGLRESADPEWDRFMFGSSGFHKYLKSEVESPFLDIPMEEWELAIALPTEDFVRTFRGTEVAVSNRSMWK